MKKTILILSLSMCFLETYGTSRTTSYNSAQLKKDCETYQDIILNFEKGRLSNLKELSSFLANFQYDIKTENRGIKRLLATLSQQIDSLIKILSSDKNDQITSDKKQLLTGNASVYIYTLQHTAQSIIERLDLLKSPKTQTDIYKEFVQFDWDSLLTNINKLLENEEVVSQLESSLIFNNFSALCSWIKNSLENQPESDQKQYILDQIEKASKDNLTESAQLESISSIVFAYNELALQSRKDGNNTQIIQISHVRALRDNIVDNFFERLISENQKNISTEKEQQNNQQEAQQNNNSLIISLQDLKRQYDNTSETDYISEATKILKQKEMDQETRQAEKLYEAVAALNATIDKVVKEQLPKEEEPEKEDSK